jgi:tetratricopeptide (TPR) repeat protein
MPGVFFGDRERVDRLEADGWAALERGDLADALAAADALLDARWSGGFVLKVQALAATGDRSGARATAEEAVKRVGDSEELWLLAGIWRSETGDLEAALDAFDRALRGPSREREPTVRYNRAVALMRLDRPHEAYEDLRALLGVSSAYGGEAFAMMLDALAALGRRDEADALLQSPELAEQLDSARAAKRGSPAVWKLERRRLGLPDAPLHRLTFDVPGEGGGTLYPVDVAHADPAERTRLARAWVPQAAVLERSDDLGAVAEGGVHAVYPGVTYSE